MGRMDKWFMARLTRALQCSCSAAIEVLSEEYRDIACACESERKANAQALAMLEEAAIFVVATAEARHDDEALAVVAREFRFFAPDAAAWAKELSEI